MLSSATLTRSQFQQACKAFIAKYSRSTSSDFIEGRLHGWSWAEHPTAPGFGFMSRLVLLSWSDTASEPDLDAGEVGVAEVTDDAARSLPVSSEALTCYQTVVFSPTYQVPAFYFQIHDSKGSPLALREVPKTSLLFGHAIPPCDTTSFGMTPQESTFPVLSQGEHPTLGTPSWYMHPCGMPSAMGGLAAEMTAEDAGGSEEDATLRWLEAWFMVLGNLVDLRV
ncbi:hypothetical protein FA95DRAFT_1537896 [Auriscalpium vulgare]|uniref:Uncharacterized protein n=1 Tax=Auriscalpium vulgare TaxID=40419 RepID=A0ACB8S0I5_9AGAM|nr:hypothetical protein FA95DRAFT_1537896 [Auriscalpium vulgare]